MDTAAPVTWTNSLAMELVRITAPFWMGATHVTVGQFFAFAGATGYQTQAERQGWSYGAWNTEQDQWDKYDKGSWRAPGFEQGDDHPIVCVTC